MKYTEQEEDSHSESGDEKEKEKLKSLDADKHLSAADKALVAGLSDEFARLMTLLRDVEFDACATGWKPSLINEVLSAARKLAEVRVFKASLKSKTSCRFPGSFLALGMRSTAKVGVLLDTGAEGAFVDESVLVQIEKKFGEKVYRRKLDVGIPVCTAGGLLYCEWVVDATVDVGGYSQEVECLVLKDCGEHVILGHEFVLQYIEPMRNVGIFHALHGPPLKCIPSNSLGPVCRVIYRGDTEDPFVNLDTPELEDDPHPIYLSLDERTAAIKAQNDKAWSELLAGVDDDVRLLLQGDEHHRGFYDVFTEVLESVPLVRGSDEGCRIELTSNLLDVVVPQYELSQLDSQLATETVAQLLASGIIETCTTTRFSSPILFVAKGKDGKRMCIDFRRINLLIALHQGDIPLIRELLKEVTGHQFISAVDLTSAFHQVRIHPEDRDVTAFRHGGVTYRFCLLPFGLSVSPIIMQKVVADLFRDIKNVRNYIDDIVIFSKNRDEHLETVRQVLTRCREQKFFLKASKCEFLKSKLKFLGYEVLTDGVTIPEDRVDAFRRWAPPKSPLEMQRTLGVFNFFRDFVPRFATIARPLQRYAALTEKRGMDEEEHEAFQELVQALVNCVPLKPFIEASFVLQTDASAYAVGAVLFQRLPDDLLYGPVAVMSKALDIHQQNYPIRQKELLAIVLALKRWRVWVLGRQIDVYTDHQSLTHFMVANRRPEVQRLTNWLESLLEFDLHIHYLKGEDNTVADYFSRCVLPAQEELYRAGLLERMKDYPRYFKMAKRDVEGAEMPTPPEPSVEVMGKPSQGKLYEFRSKALYQVREAYRTDNLACQAFKLWDATAPADRQGDLFETGMRKMTVSPSRVLLRGNKPYVPKKLAKEFIREIHKKAHLGISMIFAEIHDQWYTPNLHDVIREVVRTCDTCQRIKTYRMPALPLRMLTPPKRPFGRIHIDYLSVKTTPSHNFDAILTVVDGFSKFAIFVPARKTDSALIVARLLILEVFAIFGHPTDVVSDNGAPMIQDAIPLLLKWIGARSLTTTPKHPQANGQAERANQTILKMLQGLVKRAQEQWPFYLKLAQLEYNCSYTRAHRQSPFEVVFGFPPPKHVDLGLMGELIHEDSALSDVILDYRSVIRKAAAEALDDHQTEVAARYNEKHKAQDPPYRAGDYVLVHKDRWYSQHHAEWKMLDAYLGPYRIVRPLSEGGGNAFEICLVLKGIPIEGDDPGQALAHAKVNAKYLKPYHFDYTLEAEPPESLEELRRKWDAVSGIAFVDSSYKWLGLYMTFLAPGQIAICPTEWFRRMPRPLAEYFLIQYVLLHASPKSENIRKLWRSFFFADPPPSRFRDVGYSNADLGAQESVRDTAPLRTDS